MLIRLVVRALVNPRIELITRGERRRRWTIEQKQTIAAQSLGLGASQTEWRVNMASAAGNCRLRPTVAGKRHGGSTVALVEAATRSDG